MTNPKKHFMSALPFPIIEGVTAACAAAILLLISAPQPVHAQQQEDTQAISFNEAVQIALERNATLQQAANETELQALQVSRARSNFLPDLSLSTRGAQSYGRSFIQQEAQVVNQTSESISGGVNSSINVFNGFRDVSELERARLAEEAGSLQYERTRQQIVFEVMDEFLRLVEQREQIRVQEENLEAAQQQLRQIEEFVEVGTRPRSDLYQQQAEVAAAGVNLLNARQSHDVIEVQLIETMQLDPFGTYSFQAPSIGDTVVADEDYELLQLMRQAFDQRPDLQASSINVEAAEEGISIARSGYWPSVNLSLGYNTSYNSAVPIPFQEQIVNYNRGGSVGLSFSFPLFDRFSTQNTIQEAELRYDNARLNQQDLRQDVALEVRQAYQDYQSAAQRMEATAQQVQAAAQALEATEERYNLGASTLVELSRARSEYVQAASERVTAKYDLFFQEKLIEYHIGVLDPSEPLFN